MKYIRFYTRYIGTLVLATAVSMILGMKVNVYLFAFLVFLPNVAVFSAMIYLFLHIYNEHEKEE